MAIPTPALPTLLKDAQKAIDELKGELPAPPTPIEAGNTGINLVNGVLKKLGLPTMPNAPKLPPLPSAPPGLPSKLPPLPAAASGFKFPW